jgi:hypothetical protein
MFRKFLERRRVKRVFGKMVSPKIVDELLGKSELPLSVSPVRIGFVFALVRGETATQTSERVGTAVEIAQARAVVDILGPLVVATFGRTQFASLNLVEMGSLVADLTRQLGPNLKLVHGIRDGHSGLIGSKTGCISYSFLVPGFEEILCALGRLEFGQIEELTP